VIGYHPLRGGDVLLALDTTVELPGGAAPLVARAGDVVRFDGSQFTLALDADAAGLPRGVRTNAVGGMAGGLLLSFDRAVALGGGLVARRQDVVHFDGTSFSLVFDGAAAGVPAGLGVDGVDMELGPLYCGSPTVANRLMLSFDASGSVGGIDFDDADVLGFSSGTWTLEYDASEEHPSWAGGPDLDAFALCSVPPAQGNRAGRVRTRCALAPKTQPGSGE
jgi:hypothetical protein